MPRLPRPRGDPSIRWLLRRLSAHISTAAQIYQANNDDYVRLQQFTVNFLNQARTERFFSSSMWSTLYNLAMDMIVLERSVDIGYVIGAVEGSLFTMYPHDEL